MENKVILRNVYKITEVILQPVKDPKTGRYPEHVMPIDSKGDMIRSERLEAKIYESGYVPVAQNEEIRVQDGTTFNLDDPYELSRWEAIKHSTLIAQERGEKDENGNLVIDGSANRYGTAMFFIERPGAAAVNKTTKLRAINKAQSYIFNDSAQNLFIKARLLGVKMDGYPQSEVEAYLLDVAQNKPETIIQLYTGGDLKLRILFLEALDKKVIKHIDRAYYRYGETTILGATEESVIAWMKDPANDTLLKLIRNEVYGSSDTEKEAVTSKPLFPTSEDAFFDAGFEMKQEEAVKSASLSNFSTKDVSTDGEVVKVTKSVSRTSKK